MYKMYGDLAIYSGRAHPELAKEIANYLGVELGGIEIFEFPNENTFVRLLSSVRAKDVFFVQPTCSPVNRNLVELLIAIDTFKRDSAGRITAVIPYYGYGRTDKKDEPRVPITARLVADLITVAGANRILTVVLHAPQIQGFFNIPVDEINVFFLLEEYFMEKNIPDLVVLAPDVGAVRRGRNFAQRLGVPLAIVEKRRYTVSGGSKVEDYGIIGDVKDKNVLIVDDEIDTGSSIAHAYAAAKKFGCKDVYVCAVHPILSPPYCYQNLEGLDIKEIVVTNTVPISPEKRARLPKIQVVSIGPLLGEVIRRIHMGVSVGALFNE
jgi:ribose-phosphate pyrophosphokinase